MHDYKSPLVGPDGKSLIKADQEPKMTSVVVETPGGEKLQFPQVAVAMMVPDVIEAIAEALHRRISSAIAPAE